jgi:hypothetical protein
VFGPRGVVLARCALRRYACPRWGNLRRTRPFSEHFGFDRGTPVDRYYLHRFLEDHAHLITGDVLEIQLPGYTSRFGQGVTSSHTLDINPAFGPTYCCDLSNAAIVPSARYDCFLLPNTLYALRDVDACLREAFRIVRPGGAILAATSVFVPLTDEPAADYWRLSPAGWRQIVSRCWPAGSWTIASYGNVLAAVAAMLGLAAEELTPEELDVEDPRYPVLVTLCCRKPPAMPI